MEYRKLPKGTENISIIGLGNSSLGEAGKKRRRPRWSWRWKTA